MLLPYLEAEFKNTKEARFKEYLNLYVKTSSPTIKSLLLDIITDAKREEHLQTLLDMLSDTKVIRLQDHSGYVRDLLANHSTRRATFDWLYQNWDYLKNAVDGKSLDVYPKIMARFIRNQSDFALFQEFAKRFENDPALFRIIKIGIYEIENRLALLAKNTGKLHQKLEKYLENH